MGLLENFFVPEYAYVSNPTNYEQKLENSKFLFELIEDAGLQQPNCKPEGKAKEYKLLCIFILRFLVLILFILKMSPAET